jgi:tetratricopeptide (TPR) repeat protein
MALLQKLFLSLVFLSLSIFSFGQDKIRGKDYFLKKAFNTYQQTSVEFRACIDSAIFLWPNDAQLWREKATSHFKAGQYEGAIKYINKAVELDTLGWLGYRGFMKCVFMKDYANAIIDLKEIYKKRPLEQKMDHSYPFWIGISYLKLNQLDSASQYLQLSINQSISKGTDWVHFVDWFYFGLIKFKQKDSLRALEYFDNAIAQNSLFPDVAYYKAIILLNQKKKLEAKDLLLSARANLVNGYRMNEDNEVYVNYPYQITTFEIDEILEKLQ